MQIIGTIGILVALVLMCIMALKGVSLLVIGPVTAIIIALTNGMGIAGVTETYLPSVGSFVATIFLYTLLGAAIGKYYEVSKAANTVAMSLMKIVGADKSNSPMRIMVAMLLVSAVLTYGGVSVFAAVFALVPIAKAMFKRANLPWHLSMIPIAVGMGTFTQSLLPGNPNIANILPTAYLGTKLTALPAVGIVGSVIVVVFGLIYAKIQVKKAIAAGEGFDLEEVSAGAAAVSNDGPGVVASYTPIISLILVVFIGSAFNLKNVVYIALFVSLLLCIVLFWKYIPNQKATIAGAAANALGPTLNTSAIVGIGAVITAASGFAVVSNTLANVGGNPIVSMTLLTSVFSVITGAISGAIGIVINGFASAYLNAGVPAEVIHRIVVLAASTFTAVPWCGAVCALLAGAGLTHKQAYKHIAITAIGGQFLALIVALIMVMA